MKSRSNALLAALVAAFFMSGCSWWEQKPNPPWWPPGTETPTPVELPSEPAPTATPTSAPTPGPAHVQAFPITEGRILVRFEGLDQLPLSPTLDLLVLGVFTWETEGLDREMPLIEVAARGRSSDPCIRRPCGSRLGLVVRWSSNLRHDDRVYNEHKFDPPASYQHLYAGSGHEYGQRMPVGDWSSNPGRVDLQIQLGKDGLQATALQGGNPTDVYSDDYRHGCGFGVGRFLKGADWPQVGKRSWWYRAFSASPYIEATILEWEGIAGPLSVPCPVRPPDPAASAEGNDWSGPW